MLRTQLEASSATREVCGRERKPTEGDDTGMIRRGATIEGGGSGANEIDSLIVWRWFDRRSATRWFGGMADRGLKPTATFGGRSATKDMNQ